MLRVVIDVSTVTDPLRTCDASGAGGYFQGSAPARLVRDNILCLCSELKPDAVTLVDVIAPSDFILNSPIGHSDGQVSPISYSHGQVIFPRFYIFYNCFVWKVRIMFLLSSVK